uniref:Uncharacterized protein n=1 Tax=Rhizophora mucronata TaxID=61149 RepID=A0A2P2NF17_RHIMU
MFLPSFARVLQNSVWKTKQNKTNLLIRAPSTFLAGKLQAIQHGNTRGV